MKVVKINNSIGKLGCTQSLCCYLAQNMKFMGTNLSVQINRYPLLHVPLCSYAIDNKQLSKFHLKKQRQKAIGTSCSMKNSDHVRKNSSQREQLSTTTGSPEGL